MRRTKRRRVKRRKTRRRRRSVGGGAQGPFMVRIEPEPDEPELQLLPGNIIRVWKHRTEDIRNVEFTIGVKEYKGKIFLVDPKTTIVFGTGDYKIVHVFDKNKYNIEQTSSEE
jgi:hypothetical protein